MDDETAKTLVQTVSKMASQQDAIHRALVGEPEFKRKGFFERVEDMESRLGCIDRKAAYVAGVVATLLFILKHFLL